ncbi:MAG: hypothetical protein ACI9N9_001020, partial [Enterobacterales bacterium]
TWQHYTFNLSDLAAAASNLDMSAIDVVMVFPAWGTGNGAVYQVDNVRFNEGETPPVEPAVAITIYNDSERADWPAWDCCGGSTPMEVIDADATYGATMEFSVGTAATVNGFTSRTADGAVDGVPFDASSIAANGTFEFDLKMTGSPGDTPWLLKFESNADAGQFVEVQLSTSNEGHTAPVLDTWQHYTFNLSDLAAAASNLDMSAIDVVMVFPAWGTGNGAVYQLDNVAFTTDGASGGGGGGSSSGAQIDLPISFDDAGVDYTVTDFGENMTVLVTDPFGSNGMVAQSTKPINAPLWAGTTMSTPDGLATAVPLTAVNSTMSVWVYSVSPGLTVRLKMEDHLDVTHTVETEAMTTLTNAWEELTFDFNNEAAGTASLMTGNNNGWIYDKASIFFNFGVDGATAGEQVYYWDNVSF